MSTFSEAMRRTADSHGEEGRAWLAALPEHIGDAIRAWSLSLGPVLDGGTSAYVARVRANDGTYAVLKIAPPWDDITVQIHTMMAADGHGYARVYAYDPARRAALVESLGPALATTGSAPDVTMDILAALLREAWLVPLTTAAAVAPGADKASQLLELLVRLWDVLGQPCSRRLRDAAMQYAQRRAAAFDPTRSVVCHGDPHDANALAVLQPRSGAESGYVFVDPDGFRCDPAYDLGVVMRGWPELVLAARDPGALARSWARRLASASGMDEDPVWEWAFVERVTSGLYLIRHGHHDEGRRYLDSAETLLA